MSERVFLLPPYKYFPEPKLRRKLRARHTHEHKYNKQMKDLNEEADAAICLTENISRLPADDASWHCNHVS